MTCRNMPLGNLLATNLNPDEIEAAAFHLSACADCRERLRVMTAMKAVFEHQPHSEVERPVRTDFTRGLPLRLLAAALLLASLLPLIHLPRRDRHSGIADLATSEAYPAFPLRTRSTAPAALREDALKAYRAGRYKRAAELFSRFAEDAEARFYEGVSCYFLGRTEQALEALEASAQLDPAWREPSLWYRANALLKVGRIEDARELLTRLAAMGGHLSAAGERLLRRLDQAENRVSR